jgi:hypothetical protein
MFPVRVNLLESGIGRHRGSLIGRDNMTLVQINPVAGSSCACAGVPVGLKPAAGPLRMGLGVAGFR